MEVHYEMRLVVKKQIGACNHHQAARQCQQWVPKTAAEQDQHGILLKALLSLNAKRSQPQQKILEKPLHFSAQLSMDIYGGQKENGGRDREDG
jgi:hypothetical protein